MSESWKQDWQAVVARVGESSDADTKIRWGADRVDSGAIRRYLEPLEFDCELHYSADVARQNGYSDIVAPYTSMSTWTMSALWSPGAPIFESADRDSQPSNGFRAATAGQYPAAATGFFATDMAIGFVRPPVVGDRLGRRGGRLVDVALKETSVGRGAFLKTEAEIVDADEQTVATVWTGLYVYEPWSEARPPSTLAPAGQRDSTGAAAAATAAVVDGRRTGADVVLGESISPVEFPLPVYRLVMEAGVNRDFNSIHHNTEYAQSTGAPEMYANTLFLQGMWERTIRGYIGNAGAIKRIDGFRMKSFNCAGDTVTVRGRVDAVRPGPALTEVDLAIWSENSNGVSVGPGTATVTIPTAA
jgi:acyl dehydratase